MFKIWTQFNPFVLNKKSYFSFQLSLWWPHLIHFQDLIFLQVYHWLWIIHLKDGSHFHENIHFNFHKTHYLTLSWTSEMQNLHSHNNTFDVTLPNHVLFSNFWPEMQKCFVFHVYVTFPIHPIIPNNIKLMVWILKLLEICPPTFFLLLSFCSYHLVNLDWRFSLRVTLDFYTHFETRCKTIAYVCVCIINFSKIFVGRIWRKCEKY
jgi:hypothetical protein